MIETAENLPRSAERVTIGLSTTPQFEIVNSGFQSETPIAYSSYVRNFVLLCVMSVQVFGKQYLCAQPVSETPVQLDEKLLRNLPPSDFDARRAVSSTLVKMALSGDVHSLARLHQIFETYPEWRHLIASAISQYSRSSRRRVQDWRLLVRSLAVVEGEHARNVLQALVKFRERSTKPRWLRQVIVLGTWLGDDGANDAIALLKHWAGHGPTKQNESWKATIAQWQAWYEKKYPDEPIARLPHVPVEAKWKYKSLLELLYGTEGQSGNVERGRVAFIKANCHKCHRTRGFGEPIGPDLSHISSRMQRKEILHAVLYPSAVVPDQYLTYSIVTTDGRIFTGIVGRGNNDDLVVLQANGKKATVKKSDVDESVLSKQSAMPQGTLERLTKQEIVDLFAFLCARQQN